MSEVCYWYLCFVPLQKAPEASIFAFAEFLSALALLVVLYTITDVRYKFRLFITPGRIFGSTFLVALLIGIGTLAVELWKAEDWWVPKTIGINSPRWQAFLGILFLVTFLTWAWHAFIRPPIFSKRNAKKYVGAAYKVVLRGEAEELRMLANELARSADEIVRLWEPIPKEEDRSKKWKPTTGHYANELMFLIANRKLCRAIVEMSPHTQQS